MGSFHCSGSIRCGRCFSQVVPFLCELSPRTATYELNWPAISLLGGELALPIPRVARVSRFDRQLRYYSQEPPLASGLSRDEVTSSPPDFHMLHTRIFIGGDKLL
jgi:hypothetical protein